MLKWLIILHLTTYILYDKLYGFRFCRSTVDVLTVITEYLYQDLVKNGEAQSVIQHNSMAADRVWYAGFLCNDSGL